MRTDRLIDLLARDAALRTRFGGTMLVAVAAALAVGVAVFFSMLRPRHDLGTAVGTARFLFKFAVAMPLAVTAIGLMDRLARPAAPLGPWPWLLAGTVAILGIGIGLELSVVPAADWITRLVGTNARYCLLFIPLIATGPLVCLIAALRQGAPMHPGRAGAVAGLAASGIAATLYAVHCPDDSPLFVATWYSIATGLVVLCGYGAGHRFLRY